MYYEYEKTYTEVQNKLLKKCINKSVSKKQLKNITWGKYKDNIFISFDSYVGYLIPEEYFFLDEQKLNTLFEKRTDKTIKLILDCTENEQYDKVKFTGTVIDKIDNKSEIAVFRNIDNNLGIGFNYKLIKPFMGKNYRIEVFKENGLSKIYQDDMWTGIIMPISKNSWN